MITILLFTSLSACGGDEPAPPSAAPPPVATPAKPPPPPAPPPAAVAPTGPYTPDELTAAAYEKARAAGADAVANPKAGDPAAIAAGKEQYQKCVSCHGATGAGDGIAAGALPHKPAQFNWPERWDATSVGVKHWIVMNGITGTSMASLGLTEDQAWEVMSYIDAELRKK
jgi:mono/diheme cytochrome c family protein